MGFDLHMDIDAASVLAAFEAAPEEMADALLDATKDSAERLQRDWRSNARKTARRHGKHYPSSITNDVTVESGAITADIGPDRAKPQGDMSFEDGSVNQPPHFDAARAFATNAKRFADRVDEAVDTVVDGLE